MGGILIGFLTALLQCAIIIFIAFIIVWVLRWMGVSIDGNVYRWGQIIVGLICLLIILTWLLGVFGVVGGGAGPHFQWRW